MKTLYLIIRENDQAYTEDIKSYCLGKGLGFQVLSERRRYVLRDELKDAPKINGLCGPMWGGEHNGFVGCPVRRSGCIQPVFSMRPDARKAELIASGHLNKAGAITTKGKNAL